MADPADVAKIECSKREIRKNTTINNEPNIGE